MMILAVLLFLQDSPDVDRLARERAYDAKQRAALFGDGWPNTHLSDWVIYNPGLRVSVSGRVMGSDTVLHTYCENRLVQRDDGSSRLGTVSFDEIRVTTPDETALPLILCARCSPRDILVTGHRGPFIVSMKGTQTWFSRYDLCFESPRQGDTQYVGDMTVSVEWPRVRIKSASGWWESARPICFEFFTFELIPGSIFMKPSQPSKGILASCGNGPGIRERTWCDCDGGPKARSALPPPRRLFGYQATAKTREIPIEEVLRIKITVWKPHEIPVEFTTEVTPYELPERR